MGEPQPPRFEFVPQEDPFFPVTRGGPIRPSHRGVSTIHQYTASRWASRFFSSWPAATSSDSDAAFIATLSASGGAPPNTSREPDLKHRCFLHWIPCWTHRLREYAQLRLQMWDDAWNAWRLAWIAAAKAAGYPCLRVLTSDAMESSKLARFLFPPYPPTEPPTLSTVHPCWDVQPSAPRAWHWHENWMASDGRSLQPKETCHYVSPQNRLKSGRFW